MLIGDDYYNHVAVAIAIAVVVAVCTVATATTAVVAERTRTNNSKRILSHFPVRERARASGGSEVNEDVEVVDVRVAK